MSYIINHTLYKIECMASCDLGVTECNIIDYSVYVTDVAEAQANEEKIAGITFFHILN